MSSALAGFGQSGSRSQFLKTIRVIPPSGATIDTVWLYPLSDIETALSLTQIPHTFDGVHLVCPTLANLDGICTAIWVQTAGTAPNAPFGNGQGFTLTVGTILRDLGRSIFLSVGDTASRVIEWRLAQQLTPQSALPSSGNSPPGTIGFITVWSSFGYTRIDDFGSLDFPNIVRFG